MTDAPQPRIVNGKRAAWVAICVGFKRAQDGQVVENATITQGRRCLEHQRKLYSGAP